MNARTVKVDGDRLARLMSERGMSVDALAGKLRCSLRTIANACNSLHISKSTLGRIAGALDVEGRELPAWEEGGESATYRIQIVIRADSKKLEQSPSGRGLRVGGDHTGQRDPAPRDELARETFRRPGGAMLDDPLADPLDHRFSVILVDFKFLSNLQSKEISIYEIQACNPGSQGLVMSGEDGAGQVVEASLTALALVALAMRLGVIPAVLDDRSRRAIRAGHAIGPPHLPDRLVVLVVVEEDLDVHHRSTPRMPGEGEGRAVEGA